MNFIKIYHDLIVSKKVVVSKKVKKQVELLIEDIINPGEYHFDVKKANRPIEFVERFCKQSKGKWAGKTIKLELWQKVIIQALFGFVNEKGLRRYQELLVVVARKNGKSTLLSALGLYMLFGDKEGGAEICCLASKKEQAKIVFNEAKNMVLQSPHLSKHVKKRKSDLYTPLTFSSFMPLASDSNTLDGLNMHCGIIDELHSIKDRNLYDVSVQSMGAREQPVLCMITTAGFVRESIYDDRYEHASDVLNGAKKDKRFLSFIYELDERKEWTNPKCWQKANPGLGTIKSIEYMEQQVQKGKNSPKFVPTLLTKDFNVRENTDASWLTFEAIDNQETFDINNLKDSYALGGVDLSSVGDLTCATVILRKEKKWYILQKYWIPEERAERKIQEDKVPYRIWKESGFIDFCLGNKVNYSDITDWFLELKEKYQILVLHTGYDKWNASYWASDMQNNGFQLEEVIQGAKTMSAPMKTLSADLESRKYNYNNNPILKWCLTNTKIETDKNENIRPIKGKNKKQRIDGTVSLINACVVLERHYEDYINMTGGK